MALPALRLRTANLALPGGTPRHKAFRWVRIVAMLFVTLSSFAVRELNDRVFRWLVVAAVEA